MSEKQAAEEGAALDRHGEGFKAKAVSADVAYEGLHADGAHPEIYFYIDECSGKDVPVVCGHAAAEAQSLYFHLCGFGRSCDRGRERRLNPQALIAALAIPLRIGNCVKRGKAD